MIVSNLDFQETITENVGILGGSVSDLLDESIDRFASVNGQVVSIGQLSTESSATGLLDARTDLTTAMVTVRPGSVSIRSVLTAFGTTPN